MIYKSDVDKFKCSKDIYENIIKTQNITVYLKIIKMLNSLDNNF